MRCSRPYSEYRGVAAADETIDADAFDRYEAAGWERRASEYARHFTALTGRVIEPLLDAAGVRTGQTVVDLGCGPGHVAAACAARGADVVGVDVAGAMVALAAERHPGIRFERADAQRLPFADASMDAMVGNFVILHVGRPGSVVTEAVRILRPGGRLALSTWDGPERMRVIGVLTDALAEAGAAPPADMPAGPPFFRFADEAEFTGLITAAGLGDVRIDTVAFHHGLASAAELWNGLLAATVRTGSLVSGQPSQTQARIRVAFERHCAAYATGDGLDVPVSVKIASGWVRS